YLISLGLTGFGGVALICAFVLLVGGQVVGLEIARHIGLKGPTAFFFSFARWPLTFVIVLIATDVIYWVAPNVQLPFKWLSVGALFFVCGWLLATFGFGVYVSHFGSYGATYGTLGSMVVLLGWFYI